MVFNRTKESLFDFNDILIFYQYLYLSPDNYIDIEVNDCEIKMRLTMDDDMNIWCKNLTLGIEDPISYNDMLHPAQIIGIMDMQKRMKPVDTSFPSRYEEIKSIWASNISLNKFNMR